jgi:arylsulfatase A-like enzyme
MAAPLEDHSRWAVPMSSPTAPFEQAATASSSTRDRAENPLKPWSWLLLLIWCGLVAGLLEVAVTVVRKQTFALDRVLPITRHFVWMVPLSDLAIFLALGVLLGPLAWWGKRGRWVAGRLLCTFTLLPPIWAAFPRIFGFAGFILALGAAARLVPAVERRWAGFQRLERLSLPALVGAVSLLAASLWAQDRLKEWREAGRALPPPGSPNVLLIVMDTVAAGHLALYGYDRPTSPTLEELAARGVRFDRAQATSSWTLPSHASFFTGRWPHELSAGWLTPLDATHSTLAEFLGAHGYATAGFAANYWYCASSSGLDRGFTVYRDYIFPRLTALKLTVLVSRSLDGLTSVEHFLEEWLDSEAFLLKPAVEELAWLIKWNRKAAAAVNRELLDWLSSRRRPDRPFFAFLNYYDAHHPYQLAETGIHRFGTGADLDHGVDAVDDPFSPSETQLSPRQIEVARDTYDNCVADLDEQLGRLIDDLERRAILDRTWVIVVADHGESFGEHPGVFRHGTSLYQTELHVPLLIIPPAGARSPSGQIVTEPVSLRDLPATIVGVLGFQEGSPFRGESLARFSHKPSATEPADPAVRERALSEVVPFDAQNPDPAQMLEPRWPLGALAEGDWTYIRREGDVREELFHFREDAQELHNRALDPAVQGMLARMRQALSRLTAGPLTPQRFPR